MGFDNECILNIQSLPGEYFCPVCRLLVYPSEALQSQCTHLYCKPCLAYVAGTTRACPYDGYLVTEADSKPLVESNKALAETIGKITVHCLYNKSGCTWQGFFSDCAVHCSGCAFGNSPVVCNRCSVQIVHRQVLEHAQNCPGVPVQGQVEGAQNAAATGTSYTGNQTSQAGTIMSQGQTSQTSTTTTTTTTTTTPGLDPSQQTNSNAQAQAVTPATLMTSEQWYQQHQQQYQQYYQQYTGYDPYYQQYYQQQLQAQASQMAGQQQVYIQPQAQTQPLLQPQVQPQVQLQPQPQALQPQPLPSVQAPVVAQSQQAQGNLMQQPQPVVPPQSQAPSQTLPPAQSQSHLQVQPYLQAQPQVQPQFPPQLLPAPQSQPHLQVQPQTLAQLQSQPYSKVQPSPNQPLNPSFQPQTQHPPINAVTGHQSYQQPQTYQQMSAGGPQQPVLMNSQGGLHPQLQPPAQMQSSYPQQPPQMRPLQSHAAIPNQHTPPMLPSPVPLPPVITHGQQLPAIPVNQQPGMLPAQSSLSQQYMQQQPLPLSGQPATSVQNQTHQQAPLMQHPLPVQPQQRPKGSHPSSQKYSHAYPQMQQNLVLSQSMHPRPSQNLPGRPVVPTSGVQSQQYQQSAAGMEVKQAHFGTNQPSSGQKNIPGPNGSSGVGAGAGETKVLNSETNLKPMEEKTGVDGTDISTKEMNESKTTLGSDLGSKKPAKEEPTEDQKDVIIEHRKLPSSVLDGKNVKDGPLRSNPPLQKDKVLPQGQGAPKGLGSNEFRGFPQGQGYPVGNLQPPSLRQSAVNNPQQRPAVPGMLQGSSGSPLHAQTQSLLPGQLRPLVPGRAALPGQPLVPPENSRPGPVGRAPYGPESQFGQHFMDGRRSDPSAQSNSTKRMNRPQGLDSSPAFGFRGEKLKFGQDERLNPLDKGPRGFGRGQFEEDLKQFPRSSQFDVDLVAKFGSHFSSANPLDKGPRGLGMDVGLGPREKGPHGLPYDPMVGSGPSRFLPPHHPSGRLPPDDTVERPVGFHEDTLGRPDFHGPIPGYGRQNMDGFASRSPDREYLGMPHGFRGLHGDDIGGRENRFNDRFSDLRSHSRNGEFDGPNNNLPLGEHFRSGDLIGQNVVPSHLRRGEHLGPRNVLFGDAGGFGHERIGEFGGPGNFRHPQLGEPGFRSSFSHHGFSSDGGSYTGNMDPFDRRRKPPSMGWCRICKVDCETVEGLDIHSQSREHQKNAMDMVAIIKQNAKKQKITPGDRPFHNDSSKSRHSNFEGRAIKH